MLSSPLLAVFALLLAAAGLFFLKGRS